jgi:hypothetical protein
LAEQPRLAEHPPKRSAPAAPATRASDRETPQTPSSSPRANAIAWFLSARTRAASASRVTEGSNSEIPAHSAPIAGSSPPPGNSAAASPSQERRSSPPPYAAPHRPAPPGWTIDPCPTPAPAGSKPPPHPSGRTASSRRMNATMAALRGTRNRALGPPSPAPGAPTHSPKRHPPPRPTPVQNRQQGASTSTTPPR